MSEKVFSLIYDRKGASEAYRQVDERQIVLAILAGIVPEPSWNGSLVYVGDPSCGDQMKLWIAVRDD
jgi:NifU-like protein involved in Fe-S cluster formation